VGRGALPKQEELPKGRQKRDPGESFQSPEHGRELKNTYIKKKQSTTTGLVQLPILDQQQRKETRCATRGRGKVGSLSEKRHLPHKNPKKGATGDEGGAGTMSMGKNAGRDRQESLASCGNSN